MLLLTLIPCVLLLVLREGVNGDVHQGLDFLPKECGFIDRERADGSKYAGLYEFPWMALITRFAEDGGRQYMCSGTVINKWYVMTAGHCASYHRVSQVRVGDYDRKQDVDCESEGAALLCEDQFQEIGVNKTIVHEKYKKGSFSNDIALLRLKSPIDFSRKNAAPVCLPTTTSDLQKNTPGQEAVIAGWEWMINGETSSKLLKIKIPIKNYSECEDTVTLGNLQVNETGICTGGIEGVCPLESGSPLMIPSANKENVLRYVQYGIDSYGTRGCDSNQWSVFTDISKHMDWILSNLKD